MKKQVSDMRIMALTLVNLKGWRMEELVPGPTLIEAVKFVLCAGGATDRIVSAVSALASAAHLQDFNTT